MLINIGFFHSIYYNIFDINASLFVQKQDKKRPAAANNVTSVTDLKRWVAYLKDQLDFTELCSEPQAYEKGNVQLVIWSKNAFILIILR